VCGLVGELVLVVLVVMIMGMRDIAMIRLEPFTWAQLRDWNGILYDNNAGLIN